MSSPAETPHVVVTDQRFPDHDPYSDAVAEHGGTVSYHNTTTEAEVLDVCDDADVLVCFKAPLTENVFDRAGDLSLAIRNGSGYDNIDVGAATERGIPVSNVQGYGDEDVASHAIALMFAAAHRIVSCDRELSTEPAWGSRPGITPITGGTFGIVGFGRIGRTAARYARGLDMDVIAYDPYVDDDVFEAFDVTRADFDTVLEQSSCVSVHTPLTAETRGLFGRAEFEQMRSDAVFVNTARGPIVNESELVAALDAGEILAAGLDVFEEEPPRDTPALSCDRAVCSPHHAGLSERAQRRCMELSRDEVVRAISGSHLQNCVNPSVFQAADGLINPEADDWSVSADDEV